MNDNKIINYTILIYPLVFLVILFSGQRSVFLNSCFLFFILLIYLFSKKEKKKFSKEKIKKIFFLILFLLHTLFFLNKSNNNYVLDRLSSLYSKLYKSKQITPIFQIYNSQNFNKIIFDDIVLKQNFFDYDSTFAYGFSQNNLKEELSVKKFIKDKRLEGVSFYLCHDSLSPKLKENCDSELSIEKKKLFLESLQKKNYKLNDFILNVKSKKTFEHLPIDLAWYAHMRIGLEIWLQNPVFGVGVKNYRNECHKIRYKNFNSFSSHFCTTHPHYYIAEVLAELGLIGAIMLLLIFASIIRIIIKCNLEIRKKIILIFIFLIFFQFWFPSGRFFSSNELFYFLYFMAIFLVFKRSNKLNTQSS